MSLAEWVRGAKNGDRESQRRLIETYQTDCYRYLVYQCGDPVLADDLVQETWVLALDRIRQLREPELFKPWLLRIARTVFLMALRKRKELPGIPEEYWKKALEPHARPGEDLLDAVRRLQSLEPDFREALILVDLQGYSYAEAAEITGISENALRSRIHRARKKFEGG